MTIDDAIQRLKTTDACDVDLCEALDMAIKALEQEPCEDCIRRSDIGFTNFEIVMCNGDYKEALKMLLDKIEKAPSITPQPKIGKWKAFTHSAYHGNDEDGEPIWREVTVYHCNLCNRRTVIKEKYCPNCGCKMQEVEE